LHTITSQNTYLALKPSEKVMVEKPAKETKATKATKSTSIYNNYSDRDRED
jgi:hypothetical protein